MFNPLTVKQLEDKIHDCSDNLHVLYSNSRIGKEDLKDVCSDVLANINVLKFEVELFMANEERVK